jgi:hypothetical protein
MAIPSLTLQTTPLTCHDYERVAKTVRRDIVCGELVFIEVWYLREISLRTFCITHRSPAVSYVRCQGVSSATTPSEAVLSLVAIIPF